MEIIKHGKEYYTKTCEQCGCEFKFNGLEIENHRKDYYDYENLKVTIVKTVNCPECGNIIELSNNTVWTRENKNDKRTVN